MPLTEKKAPQDATKNALNPNSMVNKLTKILHVSWQELLTTLTYLII